MRLTWRWCKSRTVCCFCRTAACARRASAVSAPDASFWASTVERVPSRSGHHFMPLPYKANMLNSSASATSSSIPPSPGWASANCSPCQQRCFRNLTVLATCHTTLVLTLPAAVTVDWPSKLLTASARLELLTAPARELSGIRIGYSSSARSSLESSVVKRARGFDSHSSLIIFLPSSHQLLFQLWRCLPRSSEGSCSVLRRDNCNTLSDSVSLGPSPHIFSSPLLQPGLWVSDQAPLWNVRVSRWCECPPYLHLCLTTSMAVTLHLQRNCCTTPLVRTETRSMPQRWWTTLHFYMKQFFSEGRDVIVSRLPQALPELLQRFVIGACGEHGTRTDTDGSPGVHLREVFVPTRVSRWQASPLGTGSGIPESFCVVGLCKCRVCVSRHTWSLGLKDPAHPCASHTYAFLFSISIPGKRREGGDIMTPATRPKLMASSSRRMTR